MKSLAEMMGAKLGPNVRSEIEIWEEIFRKDGKPPEIYLKHYVAVVQALKEAVEVMKHISRCSLLMRDPDEKEKWTICASQDWLQKYGFEEGEKDE